MNKNKTASLIAFLGVFVLLGYQNCSKVGVEDASASAKVAGDSPVVDSYGDPVGGGAPTDGGTASDPTDTTNVDPGSPGSPGSIAGQPNNPPTTHPTTPDQDPGDVVNTPDLPSVDLNNEDVIKLKCKNVLESDEGLDLNAVNDKVLTQKSGAKFVGPVRNLTISHISSNTVVSSALNVISVDNVSGHLVMRALKVGTLSGVSGMLCVNADHVDGLVSGSHGGAHVKAKTIDSLRNHSGNLHIYGATVGKLLENSGTICLHDGAKILNMDAASAKAVSDNCK